MESWEPYITVAGFVLSFMTWLGLDKEILTKRLLKMKRGSWAVLLLMLGGWAFSGYVWYSSSDIPLIPVSWGSDGGRCSVSVDASKASRSFRENHEIAVICGFVDPAMDVSKDTSASISPLFTIQPKETNISVQYRKEAAGKIVGQIVGLAEAATLPRSAVLPVSYQWWFRVIVFRKGSDISNVHRLADVKAYGGQILRGGGQSTGIFLVEKRK